MTNHTLVLGGARSGKSRRALLLAETQDADPVFIATAEAMDGEMAERIARHQEERGAQWRTHEVPRNLGAALQANATPTSICVVDCLTVWLSNLFYYEDDISAATDELLGILDTLAGPVILVSNEVGMGLVPETPLGRQFRDAQGHLNQRVAAHCDSVEFVVAGLPLTLKGGGHP